MNTICGAGYEGTKSMITLMNKIEGDHDKASIDKTINSMVSSPNYILIRQALFHVIL